MRLAFALALVVALSPVVIGFVAAGPEDAGGPVDAGSAVVTTIDGTGPGLIVAYGPDGRELYRNDTYPFYHDVDPVPGEATTVQYVASERDVPDTACAGEGACIRNVVEEVNLTTGAVTRVYTRVSPQHGSSQIHDVDRVNETTLLVGDIGPPDRVYMVDLRTGEIVWEWRVESAFDQSSGGQYPGDWTHLNDVEYLDDGRVMVNLRNQDQVVFVEPGRGLLENWTLGRDDAHGVLYESHNPDYVPASRGGPAVLVADSENNRVIEYQRRGGEWVRSWEWADTHLQWPRDADRLPNGNTLIVDSHGNRVLSVDRSGRIDWRQSFPDGGYDAERLDTGDESAGGESAAALGGPQEPTVRESLSDRTRRALTELVPSLVLHGLLFALPMWVSPLGATGVAFGGVVAVVWLGIEGIGRWR